MEEGERLPELRSDYTCPVPKDLIKDYIKENCFSYDPITCLTATDQFRRFLHK